MKILIVVGALPQFILPWSPCTGLRIRMIKGVCRTFLQPCRKVAANCSTSPYQTEAGINRLDPDSPCQHPDHFIEFVGYPEMAYLLKRCRIVLTDRGGFQKEAFFFGKLYVNLRDETEWVEIFGMRSQCTCSVQMPNVW